jgi:hypothetical protein
MSDQVGGKAQTALSAAKSGQDFAPTDANVTAISGEYDRSDILCPQHHPVNSDQGTATIFSSRRRIC